METLGLIFAIIVGIIGSVVVMYLMMVIGYFIYAFFVGARSLRQHIKDSPMSDEEHAAFRKQVDALRKAKA
jgi:tetrahydromethanopterin S-methyltransferase subunit D